MAFVNILVIWPKEYHVGFKVAMPVHACTHTHTDTDTPRDTHVCVRAHTHTHTYKDCPRVSFGLNSNSTRSGQQEQACNLPPTTTGWVGRALGSEWSVWSSLMMSDGGRRRRFIFVNLGWRPTESNGISLNLSRLEPNLIKNSRIWVDLSQI